MTELRKSAFLECVQKNLSEDAREGSNIGTYKEKRLHRILKEFYEADLSHHEIKIGNYIADVLIENEIIEIQTGSFYPMVDKLRYYLENTDYKIRVVRPLPYILHFARRALHPLPCRENAPHLPRHCHPLRRWL